MVSDENGLARYLNQIRRFPMLEPQEEYMLAFLVAREDRDDSEPNETLLQSAAREEPDSALDEGDMRPDQVKKIAHRLGVTEQDVIDMSRRMARDASLNSPVREESEGEWQDWLVDDTASKENTLVEREEAGNRLSRAPRCARRSKRPRAAHFRGAAAWRWPNDAQGAVRRIQHFPKASASDRGSCLRKSSVRREGQGRKNGIAAPGPATAVALSRLI
jgi:Sigma-70 factor, region 1.2